MSKIYSRLGDGWATELTEAELMKDIVDYSYKPSKAVVHEDLPLFEQSQMLMVIPLFYGAMPNLGLYTYPDGPMPNPGDLLPVGKITEARESYEAAIELAVNDMVYCGKYA